MEESRHPVLTLARDERDAETAARILTEEGIEALVCGNLDDLVERLDGSNSVVLTEESLAGTDRATLQRWLAHQPPWSDVPIVLLTRRGIPPDDALTGSLGNVTLVERPFHPATLVAAVRFAARGRSRQRESAAFLEERRQTAERQTLLIRELHHRVKNTLATVQALLGASARSAHDVESFYGAFSDRIVSLAKTHNLLTEDYWQTAPLEEMLRNELGPYDDHGGGRIRLAGPPVELTADIAVPTGMAIHELTTNAAKHGALSVTQGGIDVRWEVTTAGEPPVRRLSLDWTERDGPAAAEPTRRGFGSTLLQRVLTVQCDARIEFDFRPGGLHFRMEVPLATRRLVPAY